jgi:hypothetical protein
VWQQLFWQVVPRLNPLYDETPIQEGNYSEPGWLSPIMQLNDRFGFIIWPVVGLLVVGAVVIGVLKSARQQTIPGPERMKVKKDVIHELRRQIHGMSLDQIQQMVGHPREPLEELLQEMVKDGMLRPAVNSKGAQLYKLPGT